MNEQHKIDLIQENKDVLEKKIKNLIAKFEKENKVTVLDIKYPIQIGLLIDLDKI